MPIHKYVQEASKLAKKSSDGTYRICIIDEGEGSSGRYSRQMIESERENNTLVLEGLPSFLNHPIDPSKPYLRPVESIAGRLVGNVALEEHEGKKGYWTDYKPRAEYREFVEEFADVLGVSIFTSCEGEEMDDGRIDVKRFVRDPYSSVDIVVAAGRGGRFERATESLKLIESSLGLPRGDRSAAEASVQKKEGEHMDEKDITAIAVATATAVAESLKDVISFVNESAAKKAEEAQATVDTEALDTARAEGAKAAAESFKLVDEAELPAKIAESLKAKVLEGKDITDAITEAKAIVTAVAESATGGAETTVVIETAHRGAKQNWSF